MFNNKYPYTDFHELNLDWIIEQMQTLQAEVEDLISKYKTYEDLLAEAEAYTDAEIVKVNATIASVLQKISDVSTALGLRITEVDNKYAEITDNLQGDVDTKYIRVQQMINEQWNNMIEYISQQVIDVKVRNFFTGQLVSIQSMFDYLAGLHLTDAGTYAQCSGNNTYTYYAAKGSSYTNVIMTSRTFFNS